VARHLKRKKIWQPAAQTLPARIEKALTEKRTQQALELAKTLYRQTPTPANQDLLKRASRARARDLVASGHDRDAAVILGNVASLDSSPEFLADLAVEIADSGDLARALELREKITDSAARARILTHVADEVFRQGEAARLYLPADLHGQMDSLRQAFQHADEGEDDAARDKLQEIGLQSPFLEWKVLLRGLLAYYAQDDTRAVENWQRLDPQRLPFRIAAPLRLGIDKEFARAQPPATQNALAQQARRLQNSGVVAALGPLQRSLVHERHLPQAFRTAESALPALRDAGPQLVPRFAACFYWAIIHHGTPEDLPRYRRVFGKPADDPDLDRLEALAMELRGEFRDAHAKWQRFEKFVASSNIWPPEQKDRVRALIWARMGHNADNMPDVDVDILPVHLGDLRERIKPLQPGAEECYERAIHLAPDQLANHQALICHLLRKDDAKKMEAAARRQIQQFPNDAPALELMGKMLMRSEKYDEAIDFFQRALHANPLEHRVRLQLATAHSYRARTLAEAGSFDEARAAYQAALAMDERREKYPILCKWAACEFKAGQMDKANELLQQAYAEKDSRLAVIFSMLIETIRFKLTKLKTQFNKEFNALLADPPSGAAAAALAETAKEHRLAGVKYHGQQTHEKKVRSYLEKAVRAQFTEDQLRQICAALDVLEIRRLLLDYIRLGQRLFPKDPYFFLAEAQYSVNPNRPYGVYGLAPWHASESLNKARELAQALPRGDRQDELLRQIQDCEQKVNELNPFGSAFKNLFGDMTFDPFGPFEEDDDDFEEDFF
jgi:tetratricopeptide (TPR) repeat protein